MDFMETGKLATDSIKFFVLDEAGGWLCQQPFFRGFRSATVFGLRFWVGPVWRVHRPLQPTAAHVRPSAPLLACPGIPC